MQTVIPMCSIPHLIRYVSRQSMRWKVWPWKFITRFQTLLRRWKNSRLSSRRKYTIIFCNIFQGGVCHFEQLSKGFWNAGKLWKCTSFHKGKKIPTHWYRTSPVTKNKSWQVRNISFLNAICTLCRVLGMFITKESKHLKVMQLGPWMYMKWWKPRDYLKKRLWDNFFGVTVNRNLTKLPTVFQTAFESDALCVQKWSTEYSEKWFPF